MILHRYVSHYIITYYLPSGMVAKGFIECYINYDLFEQIVYTFDKYLTTSIAICAYLYPEQNCKRAPISISQIYMVHRAIIHIIMSTLIDWIAITLIAFC